MKTQKVEKTEYDLQAENFINKTGITIEKLYTGHRKYFPDDKEFRATFQITIKRGNKEMVFDYGDSLANSWSLKTRYPRTAKDNKDFPINEPIPQKYLMAKSVNSAARIGKEVEDDFFTVVLRSVPPSDYDILACLDGCEVGSFNDWCSNYGYSTDSISALGTYQKCLKQYGDLVKLFSQEELELLSEIQ